MSSYAAVSQGERKAEDGPWAAGRTDHAVSAAHRGSRCSAIHMRGPRVASRSGLFLLQLLGQVTLDADLLDLVQLGLKYVDMSLLVSENILRVIVLTLVVP